HHQAAGGAAVAEDLPDRRPLAAPDDHGPARRRVDEEPGLHEGLVIDELVGLARLDAAVQDEALAVRESLQDLHELELGLPVRDGAGDGVGMPLDGGRGLEEPLVVGRTAHPLTAIGGMPSCLSARGLCRSGAPPWRKMPRWTSTTDARSAPNCSMR